MIPLQLGTPNTATLIAFVLSLMTTVLGFAVGYIALRGYRRNRSRPMLFVAIGFVLVFWVPVFLVVGPLLVPTADFAFGMIGELSRVIGLVSILYGLRMPMSHRE